MEFLHQCHLSGNKNAVFAYFDKIVMHKLSFVDVTVIYFTCTLGVSLLNNYFKNFIQLFICSKIHVTIVHS